MIVRNILPDHPDTRRSNTEEKLEIVLLIYQRTFIATKIRRKIRISFNNL